MQDVADHIAEMFDVQVYIIGDTCWGSCDLNTLQTCWRSILFNIGHTIAMDTFGQKVMMIGAFDDISFDAVAKEVREGSCRKVRQSRLLPTVSTFTK